MTKVCTNPVCPIGGEQPLENFWGHKQGKPRPRCSTCSRAAKNAYNAANPDHLARQRTRTAKWREENLDHAKARELAWRAVYPVGVAADRLNY